MTPPYLTFQVELVDLLVDPASGEVTEAIVWVSPMMTEHDAMSLFARSAISDGYGLRVYYRGVLVGRRRNDMEVAEPGAEPGSEPIPEEKVAEFPAAGKREV